LIVKTHQDSSAASSIARIGSWARLTFALMAVALFCGSDWRQFRGTDNTSVAADEELPISFGPGRNVAWKAALPGNGPAGPIVVGGRVVVTAASGDRQDRLHVLALDAASGKLRWERQFWATGSTTHSPFGGVAANTPASDGRRIFALFSSNDLACFDLDGNLQWLRGLSYECPLARNNAGMASSPLVVGGVVIAQVQNAGESFVVGIDASTGQTRWRIEREQAPIWSSPTVLRGRTPADDLVLLQSRSIFTAHDPATGRVRAVYDHWCDTIASATTADGRVFLPASGIHALECDVATGRLTARWTQPRLRSGESSPVVSKGRIYVVKDGSILVCGDASDGRILWQLRLKGPIWATPVLAGGHLYLVNHDGLVQTVRVGEKPEVVATSRIDPAALASPAVADGAIYFRCPQSLWKIAKTTP
jgi:outer membrane protein assembly factor BamB